MEVWKPLDRLPGYEVSSHGRVRSNKSGKLKFMSVVENNTGYMLCCLFHNKKRYTSYVHRLVAEVFIPTKLTIDLMVVNHIDRNPKNNHVDNLEWVTLMENQLHWADNERYVLLQRLKKVYDSMSNDDLRKFVELSEDN
jgi:hypothetical protein